MRPVLGEVLDVTLDNSRGVHHNFGSNIVQVVHVNVAQVVTCSRRKSVVEPVRDGVVAFVVHLEVQLQVQSISCQWGAVGVRDVGCGQVGQVWDIQGKQTILRRYFLGTERSTNAIHTDSIITSIVVTTVAIIVTNTTVTIVVVSVA